MLLIFHYQPTSEWDDQYMDLHYEVIRGKISIHQTGGLAFTPLKFVEMWFYEQTPYNYLEILLFWPSHYLLTHI